MWIDGLLHSIENASSAERGPTGTTNTINMLKDAAKLAAEAGATALQAGRLRELGIQLLADANGAALVLVAALAISIYKPWGVVGRVTRGLRVFIAAVCALVAAFVVLHFSGHSPHRHSH